jgi:hypothetical protein
VTAQIDEGLDLVSTLSHPGKCRIHFFALIDPKTGLEKIGGIKVVPESMAWRQEGAEMDKEQFKALQRQLTRFERQVGMNHGGLAVLIEQLQTITKLLGEINQTMKRNAKK